MGREVAPAVAVLDCYYLAEVCGSAGEGEGELCFKEGEEGEEGAVAEGGGVIGVREG